MNVGAIVARPVPTVEEGIEKSKQAGGNVEASKPKNGALIDCFNVTFPVGVGVDTIIELFGVEGWIVSKRAYRGYDTAIQRGNVSINWHTGRASQGIHVRASGQGCRELEAAGVVKLKEGGTEADWPSFFGLIQLYGGKPSRMDVAFDDRAGVVTSDRVRAALAGRDLVASASHYREVASRVNISTGEAEEGFTVYFGERTCETLIRIYDKTSEQRAKARDQEEWDRVPAGWMRIELELKGETALRLMGRIADEGFGVVAKVLHRDLDFKERTGDSNRSRRPTAAWWSEFLQTAEKLKLGTAPVKASIPKMIAYIERQVAPTLAVLAACRSGFGPFIAKCVEEGAERLNPLQKEIIRTETGRWERAKKQFIGIEEPWWEQLALIDVPAKSDLRQFVT